MGGRTERRGTVARGRCCRADMNSVRFAEGSEGQLKPPLLCDELQMHLQSCQDERTEQLEREGR